MKWLYRFLAALGAAALLAALCVAVTMYFAGQWMQVNDQPKQADYILPLAGDKHRLIHAADLFKQGFAPTILVSLPASKPPSKLAPILRSMGYPQLSNKEFARIFYRVLGISPDALQSFGHGHLSTIEEAEALRDFLGPGNHRLLLITSPYHARRAKMIFERTLPQAEITMTVTPYEHFNEKWWSDYYTAPKVVLEAAKCAYYLLGGVFRSTD